MFELIGLIVVIAVAASYILKVSEEISLRRLQRKHGTGPKS